MWAWLGMGLKKNSFFVVTKYQNFEKIRRTKCFKNSISHIRNTKFQVSRVIIKTVCLTFQTKIWLASFWTWTTLKITLFEWIMTLLIILITESFIFNWDELLLWIWGIIVLSFPSITYKRLHKTDSKFGIYIKK